MKHKMMMKKNIQALFGIFCLAALGVVTHFAVRHAMAAPPKKTKVDIPTISCDDSTQVSINVRVCAGATGAPAGFSIQWMTAADYESYGGWRLSEDPLLCKASFSGNANLSRYNLAPYECVTVNLGEFLFDEGASTNCPDALTCGTEYVFRSFAHANSSLMRSDFTGDLYCSTLDCDGPGDTCTLTQGFWKTHGPEGCVAGNNVNLWPVDGLLLGTQSYSDIELCSIFNTPAAGNGLISLAHQLIAAKLNVANGADDTDVADAIDAADALIGGLVVPPVGTGNLAPGVTSELTSALGSYNEGATGPGHCP